MADIGHHQGYFQIMTKNTPLKSCTLRGTCKYHRKPDKRMQQSLQKIFPYGNFTSSCKWTPTYHTVCLMKPNANNQKSHKGGLPNALTGNANNLTKHTWQGHQTTGEPHSYHKHDQSEFEHLLFSFYIYICVFDFV